MDINIKDEVVNDFKQSLSNIDFSSYNPMSKEFETSLYIGLMGMVLDCLGDKESKLTIYSATDDISEEIYGAKKYLQDYLDLKDEGFKKMASDELDHATFLIKKAYNKPIGNEEKSKLKKYESDIEQVREQIRAY